MGPGVKGSGVERAMDADHLRLEEAVRAGLPEAEAMAFHCAIRRIVHLLKTALNPPTARA